MKLPDHPNLRQSPRSGQRTGPFWLGGDFGRSAVSNRPTVRVPKPSSSSTSSLAKRVMVDIQEQHAVDGVLGQLGVLLRALDERDIIQVLAFAALPGRGEVIVENVLGEDFPRRTHCLAEKWQHIAEPVPTSATVMPGVTPMVFGNSPAR